MQNDCDIFQIIRMVKLCAILGISKSTVYDKLNPKSPRHDPTFPRPIKLGTATIGFLSHEVDAWIKQQAETSRKH